jgi:hypothetical protein
MVCFALGPLSIGDCGSKSNIKITTQSLTSNVTNSYKNTVQTRKEDFTNITRQKVKLVNYNAVAGCKNLEITQTVDVSIETNTTLSDITARDMLSNLATTINNDIEQKMEQIKSALADVNNTELVLNAKTIITRISEDNNVINTLQEAITNSLTVTDQEIELIFGEIKDLDKVVLEKDTSGTCKIAQDVRSKIVATATLNTLLDALNSDTQMQDIQYKLQQDQKLKSKGAIESVGDAISSIFKAIFSVWGLIIVSIIVFIIVIIFVFAGSSKSVDKVEQYTSAIKQVGETGTQLMKTAKELKRPI